jgi:hypothetical protein
MTDRKFKATVRCIAGACLGFVWLAASIGFASETLPVTFSGGHETDKRDNGRPVELIAAALDVKPEVFRDAFSRVTPAKNGKPSGAEARRNKEILLKALGPHGITNERLDEVSNYYRYRPQEGELWPSTPAKAHAIVDSGRIKSIVVDEPGSGYSSAPTATIKGMGNVPLKVTLKFGTDLRKNGAVEKIEVDPSSSKKD